MVKADEGTAERQERLMDVRPPFIPDTLLAIIKGDQFGSRMVIR
jgi:hypothetical protein